MIEGCNDEVLTHSTKVLPPPYSNTFGPYTTRAPNRDDGTIDLNQPLLDVILVSAKVTIPPASVIMVSEEVIMVPASIILVPVSVIMVSKKVILVSARFNVVPSVVILVPPNVIILPSDIIIIPFSFTLVPVGVTYPSDETFFKDTPKVAITINFLLVPIISFQRQTIKPMAPTSYKNDQRCNPIFIRNS